METSRNPLQDLRAEAFYTAMMQRILQSNSKQKVSVDDWEAELSKHQVSKEDLNNLVMDYLVSEEHKEAAEAFQEEANVTSKLSGFLIV